MPNTSNRPDWTYPRKIISGREWEDYGAHLKFLALHHTDDEPHEQIRLIKMWSDPNNRETQEVIFTENKISEKLYEKIQKMIEEENS
jgi:hypothetical protein